MLARRGFRKLKPGRIPRAPLVVPDSPREPIAKMTKPQVNAPVPKETIVRDEKYRRLVASLRCHRCKLEGYSNACHGDEGKAMARKTCDLTCWPGCATRPDGSMGCHEFVSRFMTREERRAFEKEAAEETIRTLIEASQATGKEAGRIRKILRDVGLVKA